MAPFGMVNADSGKGIEYDALENMASFALLCALQKSKVDSPSLSNYTSVGRRIILEEPRPRLLLAFFLLAHDAPERESPRRLPASLRYSSSSSSHSFCCSSVFCTLSAHIYMFCQINPVF